MQVPVYYYNEYPTLHIYATTLTEQTFVLAPHVTHVDD